uniref:Uncharacterized protein n=1 Tax=Pararge aegeria TaxID=116150 RepID=S4P8M9_9NEOP
MRHSKMDLMSRYFYFTKVLPRFWELWTNLSFKPTHISSFSSDTSFSFLEMDFTTASVLILPDILYQKWIYKCYNICTV